MLRHCCGIVADIVGGIVAGIVGGIVAGIISILLQALLRALLQALFRYCCRHCCGNFLYRSFFFQIGGDIPNRFKVSPHRFSGISYLLIGIAFRLLFPRFVQLVRRLSWTLNTDIAERLPAFEKKF